MHVVEDKTNYIWSWWWYQGSARHSPRLKPLSICKNTSNLNCFVVSIHIVRLFRLQRLFWIINEIAIFQEYFRTNGIPVKCSKEYCLKRCVRCAFYVRMHDVGFVLNLVIQCMLQVTKEKLRLWINWMLWEDKVGQGCNQIGHISKSSWHFARFNYICNYWLTTDSLFCKTAITLHK